MIHSLTADGLAPRVRVSCSVCGHLGTARTDSAADAIMASHK
jgi:hypothetical protein